MELKDIREIIELMDQKNLVEFEYEENGRRIRLRKHETRVVETPPVVVGRAAEPVAPVAAPAPSATPAPAPVNNNLIEFKSPLVGTFYRSPKPGAPPFVEVGDEVTPEKVLCIIEAMKVMNEIKAQGNGVIRQIVAKDGQAVEFGELLFLIEKK